MKEESEKPRQSSEHEHHHDHHRKMIQDFRKRFWISLVLTVPILLLSPLIQQWLEFEFTFNGDQYVLLAFSTAIFIYGGFPFLKGLVNELKDKKPGMMTLIAVAIIVAFGYSASVVLGLEGKTFFWELATLIDVMLVGHWIEMKSVLGASKALEKLMALMPEEAHLIDGDDVRDVLVNELNNQDIILVKPGEKIPADGEITEGESSLNESMMTGESKPIKKGKGDKVIGGSVNGSGTLKVEVHGVGEESYLSRVINMVEEAQKRKSKTQKLADKAAFWLTLVALSVGFGTLVVWLSAGYQFSFALERMVTVMVISCPHALGLAIPLVSAISTSVSAENGLLIRNRTAFENARRVSMMVFDKTGTLTKGEFGVTEFDTFDDQLEKKEILRLAASLERHSEHPIAGGILSKAREMEINIPEVVDFKNITGKGVQGKVEGKSIKIVSPGYLEDAGIDKPEELDESGGKTIVMVLVEDKLAGYIALSDQVRPESAEAIETLHNHGVRTMMLTGDNEAVAKEVSEQLNIDSYKSEVLPDEKMEIIKELQGEGKYVAMTGDGVNDAPALAQADIGIAVGSGTDIAAETADIIIVRSNPKDIVQLILFGKATYRKMIQNLFWATAYNILAIPLAAGVLYSWGIMISPALGAALMSLSTVIVAINAGLLRYQLQT